MKQFPVHFCLIAFLLVCSNSSLQIARAQNDGETVTVSGLIIPRDNEGMYVRNPEGQFEIEWNDATEVALDVNTRLLSGLKNDVLGYKVQASKQVIDFAIPQGPIAGIVKLRNRGLVASALKVAESEKWIAEFGLILRFNEKLKHQLATQDDPRFIGQWDPTAKPRRLEIDGQKYEVSLKKGGQTNALLFNMIGVDDCKPFVNRARVIGKRKGDVIVANEIHVLPIGDQTSQDNPKLPRYLFIGDSISGNYNNGLRKSLADQYNIHHPPTNCGPSGKGKDSIVEWLGGYQQKGRHWDVISFNFGHWDAGNDKATYQANLEAVIAELKKTEAKLIWVTTCPVPRGMPPAGDLSPDGKAPRRTSGVMKKYLNPWALEVIKRHSEISVCDQWQFVKDNEDQLYAKWWKGDNVHFSGERADALGKYLSEHVMKIMK
jgi:acyl-CoA thioesterase-1